MNWNPKTREEAEQKRYGKWTGNPDGRKYDPARCAYEIWPAGGGGWVSTQCCRNPGHGPAGLYCKQHAEKVKR